MRTAKPAASGYTLLEMMVVIAIIGMLAAASVPAIGSVFRRDRSRSNEVVQLLERARMTARETGAVVTVTLGQDGTLWMMSSSDRDTVGRLGKPVRTIHNSTSPAVIRFSPWGGADGGPLVVEEADRSVVLLLDFWTGRISVSE